MVCSSTPSPARPRYGHHMKIRFTHGERHRLRDEQGNLLDPVEIFHYVEFYTQPARNYWFGRLYHWYDMNKIVHWISHRLPERSMGKLEDGTDFMMPHCCFQDCRCYHLSQKNRTKLFETNITSDQRSVMQQTNGS